VTFPRDIGVIDLMLGVPPARENWAKDFGSLVRNHNNEGLRHGAGYMFKDLPEVDENVDYITFLIAEMDKWGIDKGLLPVAEGDAWGRAAIAAHPDRLFGFFMANPNAGMEGVRALEHAVNNLGAVAAAVFPAGTNPQVAIHEPRMYPLYAKCVELNVPMFLNAGVPGPRFPMYPQKVEHLDIVMYDFPDLVVITRHGAEPWEDLMVKLMLKWPNLYYSTSAFAPKHYPKAIINYANTRGADKIMYAGYFPSGLSLERIMTEMPNVPFKDDVWPKFLRENALRVLNMGK
jgi:predicted TIM-barrel fold metal-dependent hydrolase